MLCSKFFLPWVCSWEFKIHFNQIQSCIVRSFKVKWWSNFKEDQKISKEIIQKWLSSQNFISNKEVTTFFAQKSNAQALLAQAKTRSQYKESLLQLANSIYDSDDDSSPVHLGDDNEDDCHGIFSPVVSTD